MSNRPLRLEWIEAGSLAENPHNWRRHPEGQMQALKDVIGDPDIGWAGACLYNERTSRLIDGHARRKAVDAATVVPVLVGNWSEEAEKKILLTLDPLAGLATPDTDKLKELLDSVTLPTDALAALGKGLEDQLAEAISGSPASTDIVEDEAPEASNVPARCKAGDMWTLGDHRLLCGDSRKSEDIGLLLGGEVINVAVTSPPYASQRKYDESSGFKPIPPDEYVEWWEAVQANVKANLAGDGSFFVNIKEHAENGERDLYVLDLVVAHKRSWGWKYIDELVWKHSGVPISVNGRFKNGWEPVFHFALTTGDGIRFNPLAVGHESDDCLPKGTGKRYGDNGNVTIDKEVVAGIARPSNVIEPGRNNESHNHSAAFPVGLPAFFIKAFSDAGDVIYEPFCGSGTTLIAAEQLNRRCYGMEISPKYCDIILARWEKLTGKQAEKMVQ